MIVSNAITGIGRALAIALSCMSFAAFGDDAMLQICLGAAADYSPVFPTSTIPASAQEVTAVFRFANGEIHKSIVGTWIAVDVGANQVWYGALRINQFKFFYTSPGAHTMESRGTPSPAKAVAKAITALYEIPLPPIVEGIASFNKIVVEESKKRGLRIVDIFELSKKMGTDRSLVAADGLHPSAREYAEWEKIIFPAAAELLRKPE